MVRRSVRLAAAVLIAVGLVFAACVASSSAKSKKSEKPAKAAKVSKKDAKRYAKDKTAKSAKKSSRDARKSSKHAAKHDAVASKRAKSSSRDKNGDDDDDRSSRARRTTSSAPIAKRTVDGFDENDDGTGDDAEEPAGPKPANRIVADITPGRVIQIQTALIGKGLLAGPVNGVYDQQTFQAMAAFQTRNGWNPVGVPTADSLKALGVPKNSGRGFASPSSVVDATAPSPQNR